MTHIERTDRTDLPITVGNVAQNIPAARFFEMLDLTYGLRHFDILPKIPNHDAVTGMFEDAVSILAALAENRIRRGLYRRHVERPEDLRFIPNRVGGNSWLQKTFGQDPYLRCRYDGSMSDFEDNEILLWSLYTASKARLSRDVLARRVRHGYRTIAGSMTPTDEYASAGITRFYRRMSDGDRPVHGLCRLILEHIGSGFHGGGERLIPLTVNTPALFRAFVVAWLTTNLPRKFSGRARHTVRCDADAGHMIQIDFAIEDAASRQTVMVLDTAGATPTTADFRRVAARAAATGRQAATDPPAAILIYPAVPARAAQANDMSIGGVSVRAVTFDLSKDLSAAGADLLAQTGLKADAR